MFESTCSPTSLTRQYQCFYFCQSEILHVDKILLTSEGEHLCTHSEPVLLPGLTSTSFFPLDTASLPPYYPLPLSGTRATMFLQHHPYDL